MWVSLALKILRNDIMELEFIVFLAAFFILAKRYSNYYRFLVSYKCLTISWPEIMYSMRLFENTPNVVLYSC